MNEKIKNMLLLLAALLIVGFVFFGVSYWLLNTDVRNAISIGLSGSIGGFLGQYLVSLFKKGKD